MKRDYFSQDGRTERRFGEHRSGSCMALIDARFLMWLAQQGATGASGESVNRQGLLNLLSLALAQADRRVVVNSQILADLLQGKLPVGMGLAVEDVEELRQSMQEVITAWWADEPEDLREDLRDALQVSRGIPQEVDRQLLLRMRQRLTRALSLPEKKMLRETLRTVVAVPVTPTSLAWQGLPPETDA